MQQESDRHNKTVEILKRAYDELKVRQLQLFHSQKLAALGQLATGVAHEINNPLFVISSEAEMLLNDENSDDNTKAASKIIIEQVKRIKDITERLLEFSRKREFKLKPLEVDRILEKSITLLTYQARMEDIEIRKEIEPNLPKILGDSHQLQEVFLNLMLNAVQAMEKGGKLTVRVSKEEVTKYGRRETDRFKLGMEYMAIEFRDTGSGMDEETLNKIFDPFFTTREKGVGLGLSVSYGIIDNHKGIIEAQSRLGEGSVFIVKLPILGGEYE